MCDENLLIEKLETKKDKNNIKGKFINRKNNT